MAGERFKEQQAGTFFGDFLYQRAVPADHFLRQLDALVPWQRFAKKLVRFYVGKARQGRPPYDPAVLLTSPCARPRKMLLVAYLYNLSERQVEEAANYHLPVKWFLGLAVNERPPDHSTLTRFKERLLERGKLEAAEDLLAQMVSLARQHGIRFGSIQVMDSVPGRPPGLGTPRPTSIQRRTGSAGSGRARRRGTAMPAGGSKAAGGGKTSREGRSNARSTSWPTLTDHQGGESPLQSQRRE